jgi:sec-independent protein translocase protein TatC
VKEKKLTLVGHLAELRKRIAIAGAAFLAASGVSYSYIQPLVKNVLKPGAKFEFIYVAPPELLLAYIKLSLLAGTVIASPISLWEIWAFVKLGLKKEEKKYIIFSFIGGTIFMVLGAVFAYKIILPFTLAFFANLSTQDIKPMISFKNYIDFITTILLSFGLVFEMPILIILLTRFGIIKVEFLTKNRKYAVLIIVTLAAIITPPDVISQILLASPMLILFEISIIASKITTRKKRQKLLKSSKVSEDCI